MEIILSAVGLLLSFYFAGAETAFISTNQIRIEIWVRNKIRTAGIAKGYFENPDLFLSTTLVGNNLANVVSTTYATIFLVGYWGETVTLLIVTLILLLFGEIIPKVLFRTHAHGLILKITFMMRIFSFLLFPLISIASFISKKVVTLLGLPKSENNTLFDKDDLVFMLNEARISGIVDEQEKKIISRVMNLPETYIREAMVPRTSIYAIEQSRSVADLKALIAKTGKTKIPVYKSEIDNIIGIVFMYDLFGDINKISDVMRPAIYVPENKKCNELLNEFRKNNISMAVIVDEHGGTAGIITTEDLIEELFGEIDESNAEREKPIVRINKSTWKIKANEPIESVNEHLPIDLPHGEYETIAGLILAGLGRIPKVGENIDLDSCIIRIIKADNNKISQVRIIVKE
ncbi:MAG: HlyC/CorC family transporter [Calditrichales bacterium]|nr:MAG: HlyC/CorC family transporter [Calditrichales bacterium]